jgi:hypothetical protein
MKETLLFTRMFAVASSPVLIEACQRTSIGPNAASQKENLQVRAGFRTKTVTTSKQQQHFSALPPSEISIMTDDQSLFCGCDARAASRSHSGIRCLWPPWGMIEN